jgi:hypothetical protein
MLLGSTGTLADALQPNWRQLLLASVYAEERNNINVFHFLNSNCLLPLVNAMALLLIPNWVGQKSRG